MTNNNVRITINGIVIECTQEQAIAIAQACGTRKGGNRDNAPAPAPAPKPALKEKNVPFTKHDGTVIYGTQAQVDAWTKRQQGFKTPEQLAAITFDGNFTAEMDAWIIAHPVCKCKEFKAQFPATRGCTKEQLKAHKAELRAKKLMK